MYIPTEINLSPGLRPYGESQISFAISKFPSGELHFRILDCYIKNNKKILITTRLVTSDDIVTLMLVVDTLRRTYSGVDLYLFVSFLSFARQDRSNFIGESFSLSTIANLINSMNFRKIEIFEPHSEISLALINYSRGLSITNTRMYQIIKPSKNVAIVCPDVGAIKRINNMVETINDRSFISTYKFTNENLLIFNKKRDLSNGNILGHELLSTLSKNLKEFYIVDDICDGGATFISIAKLIKEKVKDAKIYLMVSHGIFSKGIDHMIQNGIDHIYTTNSFKEQEAHPNLTTIKLENLLYER